MPGADDFTPAGYEACRRCGSVFVEGSRRSGRCSGCDEAVAALARAEIVVRIGDVDVVRGPQPKRRRRSKRSPVEKERRRLWNRARSMALQRLAKMHPSDYAALLEAAKDEVGLPDQSSEVG